MLAVITYIYPAALKFLPDFLLSVSKQTVKGFELLVFNDGIDNAVEYFKTLEGSVRIVEVSGCMNDIRFHSFEYLKDYPADCFLFQDVDDMMSDNRVEIMKSKLKDYVLVCNDLSTFSVNAVNLMEKNIWKNRLGRNFEFDWRFIEDKNIVGLGNTAIRRELLHDEVKFSKQPLAADWFLFYQLLYNSKQKALFTSECVTLYRQHNSNIAGANKEIDKKRILHTINIKKAQYLALDEAGYDVKELLNKILILEQKINNLQPDLCNCKNLFWWEETNFI